MQQTVYRIIDRETGVPCRVYDYVAHRHRIDFDSPAQARECNPNKVFQNKKKYAIAEYVVTYLCTNQDVDP